MAKCLYCNATGDCVLCGGTGYLSVDGKKVRCSDCRGSTNCPHCNGTGVR